MTTGAIKYLALFFMTIDHIGEFFSGSPIWFRYIGRLAAPLFFFSAAEGIFHTKNRLGYVYRLYIASVLMSLTEVLMRLAFGIELDNNIFASIFHGVLLVYILLEFKNSPKKRNVLIALYVVWQIAAIFICIWIIDFDLFYPFNTVVYTILGSYEFSAEGAYYLTFAIVIFYLCRDSKKRLAIVYTLYCVMFFALTVLKAPIHVISVLSRLGLLNDIVYDIINYPTILLGFEISANISGASYFHLAFEQYYQWIMIFALPIILSYNGKRGNYPKPLFYIYYPSHLYALAAISMLLN